MENTYNLDGTEYRFNVMPPTTALPLMTKLLNIIGSGAGGVDLGEVIAAAKSKKLPEGEVLEAIGNLMANLKGEDMTYIAMACSKFIAVKNPGEEKPHPCNIDLDFTGKLFDLLKVIGHFLKHTFKDFFQGSLLKSDQGEKATE